VACAPTGITTLILGRYIKGSNYQLVLNNFFFTTFASLFYIPIILRLVLSEAVKFDISPYTLFGQMTLFVVLPYILSRTVVRLFHHLTNAFWLWILGVNPPLGHPD
jgi:predicted Na+-dependent transporter